MTSTLTSTSTFVLTLLIGVWAAYDRPAAWVRFALLIGGLAVALAIVAIGRRTGGRGLAVAAYGCALLAAAIGLYFVLTYDWQARGIAKVPGLYPVGLWLQAHRPALPVPEDIHSNVAGGAIVLSGLLGVGGVVQAYRQRWPRPILLVGVAASAVAGIALLLTVSRGAWIGLAAGASLAAFSVLRRRVRDKRSLDGAFLLFETLLVALLFVSLAPPAALRPITDSSVASRPQLWRWGLDLIADYPFTGSGLGSTMMVLSSYVLMLHVGFIHHVHNLYLQVAVEQGLPGLLAFGSLVMLGGSRLWRAYRARGAAPLTVAAAASLAALLIHGVVDAGLYASRLGPLIFLPIGFALAVEAETDAGPGDARQGARGARAHLSGRRSAAALALIGALLLILALTPAVRAILQANLGALAQTRAELSVYRWPAYSIQDALRRQAPGSPPPVDLLPAIARYQAALALDPQNATANRRLGQIELSLGEYAPAGRHLEAAYRAAPDQQAVRFLWGESEAIAGRIESAVAIWAGVGLKLWWNQDWAGKQAFDLRAWWYGAVGEPDNQQRITQAIRRLRFDRP